MPAPATASSRYLPTFLHWATCTTCRDNAGLCSVMPATDTDTLRLRYLGLPPAAPPAATSSYHLPFDTDGLYCSLQYTVVLLLGYHLPPPALPGGLGHHRLRDTVHHVSAFTVGTGWEVPLEPVLGYLPPPACRAPATCLPQITPPESCVPCHHLEFHLPEELGAFCSLYRYLRDTILPRLNTGTGTHLHPPHLPPACRYHLPFRTCHRLHLRRFRAWAWATCTWAGRYRRDWATSIPAVDAGSLPAMGHACRPAAEQCLPPDSLPGCDLFIGGDLRPGFLDFYTTCFHLFSCTVLRCLQVVRYTIYRLSPFRYLLGLDADAAPPFTISCYLPPFWRLPLQMGDFCSNHHHSLLIQGG